MDVHIVDPAAYTPPYDHALCAALARAGVHTTLYTSAFAYGSVAEPDGYLRRELFYRAARGPANSRLRRALKLAEHVPDMLRYRREASRADVVHFQWLAVQHIDGRLLPHGRPLVLTAHDILPREPRAGQRAAQRRLYEHFDAIVVHSSSGRERLTRELDIDPQRVHVIPHGAFVHLAAQPALPPAFDTDRPVVLFFGLIRPYKGLDVLLEAWQADWDAELWVVGAARTDIGGLRSAAPTNVRFVERFIEDRELPAYFGRADVVVLPYRESEQSGVLATALAFGKALVLTDVGGFGELGAGRLVPPGDASALRAALGELLSDPGERARLADAARTAAAGPYSWDRVASLTAALYENLRR